MLKVLLKALKVLNSDVSPNQIAAGFILGFFLGLTPLLSLHNLIILFIICLSRVNIASALLAVLLANVVAYILDPIFNQTGLFLLQHESLQAIWHAIYQTDVGKLSKFNHTLVMGSCFYALVTSIPLFFVAKMLIIKYRERILAAVEKSRAMQMLKASKWFQRAQSVQSVVGE